MPDSACSSWSACSRRPAGSSRRCPSATHVAAAMTLARFGTEAQRRRVAPRRRLGRDRCSPRRSPRTTRRSPSGPSTTAHAGTGERLVADRRRRPPYRAGTEADLFLVPASTDDGAAVFLVRPRRRRRHGRRRQQLTDGDGAARVELDGVVLAADRRLGGADAARLAAPSTSPSRWRAEQLGRLRGRARADGGVRPDARAVRATDRHVPGGVAAAGRRLHRRPGAAADRDPGGLAARGGPALPRSRSRRPSCGPPTPVTRSRTRPCTCTAASASTSTARRTATSPPPSGSRSSLGGTTLQARAVGRSLAAEPV